MSKSVSPEELKSVQKELESLRKEVSRMELLTMAMWESVKERIRGLDDNLLLERMNEIDMRDGVITGEATKEPDICPECSRPVSVKVQRCIYCGIHVPRKTPF